MPWTLTAAAMMATAVGGPVAIPVGLGVGLAVGFVNGLGVAYLRVPSMIFTLGVNAVMRGLMVAHTGGFAPQTAATDLMRYLAAERTLGIPNALFVWAGVSVVDRRSCSGARAFGRYIYAIGNREAAAYLSGIRTRARDRGRPSCSAGCCAGLAGVLLAGYSHQGLPGHGRRLSPARHRRGRHRRHQHPGRPRAAISARWSASILIVLLNSVLSIMQMPEAGRQIIYGVVIIVMLLAYGRGQRAPT